MPAVGTGGPEEREGGYWGITWGCCVPELGRRLRKEVGVRAARGRDGSPRRL